MNRTTSTSIGGRNFILDETAYNTLEQYLRDFRKDLEKKENQASADEVMNDVENRIADILKEKLHGREVVDEGMVREVIAQLGLPGGESFRADSGNGAGQENRAYTQRDNGGQLRRKLYRDPDRRVLGGVCSGLAWYLDTDVVLMRVLFVVAFIFGFAGFWIYLVIWIIAPPARTMVEKSEMTGSWQDGGCGR